MSTTRHILRLMTRADGFDSDNEFEDQFLAGLVCRKCCGVLPGAFPKPLDVRVRNHSTARVSATIGVVLTSGAFLARRELIAQLEAFTAPLAIGRVIGRDRVEIASHRTCYGSGEDELRTFAVRPTHSPQACAACGRELTEHWQGHDNGFVLEKDLRGRAAWFSRHSFLVTPETLEHLELGMFPDLTTERVAVVRSLDEGRGLALHG